MEKAVVGYQNADAYGTAENHKHHAPMHPRDEALQLQHEEEHTGEGQRQGHALVECSTGPFAPPLELVPLMSTTPLPDHRRLLTAHTRVCLSYH